MRAAAVSGLLALSGWPGAAFAVGGVFETGARRPVPTVGEPIDRKGSRASAVRAARFSRLAIRAALGPVLGAADEERLGSVGGVWASAPAREREGPLSSGCTAEVMMVVAPRHALRDHLLGPAEGTVVSTSAFSQTTTLEDRGCCLLRWDEPWGSGPDRLSENRSRALLESSKVFWGAGGPCAAERQAGARYIDLDTAAQNAIDPNVTNYTEFAPDPCLAEHVACLWSSDVAAGADASYAVLPDGCIDLLYDASRGNLSVVGTMTRTLWVRECGPSRFIGIRFKPGGAVPFLDERADLLTDQLGDPEVLFGRDARALAARLQDAPSDLSCHRRILRNFLLDRLRDTPRPVDRRVAWATVKLTAEPETHVANVAQDLGLSRQYLRRLFLQETGVSPKMYARIMRLQKLVGAMRSKRRLVDLAFEVGYADQAHMTNEFRALVGTTPQRYRARVSIPSRLSEA